MLRNLLVWGVTVAGALPGGLALAQTAATVEVVRLPAGDLQPQVVLDREGVLHRLTFRNDPAAGDVW